MGREAVCVAHWQDQVGEVQLHLDSKELTLRGDVWAAIPRGEMHDIMVCDEGVRVMAGGEELLLEFAQPDAEKWVKALLKTPPTLAQKLGISEAATVFISGAPNDVDLEAALAGAEAKTAEAAGLLLAVVLNDKDLALALRLAEGHPSKHIWLVYEKGKAAGVGDTAVRVLFRKNGFIDSKSCAVSARLTATRYRKRAH